MSEAKVQCRNVDELVEQLKGMDLGFNLNVYGEVRDRASRCPLCAAAEMLFGKPYPNHDYDRAAQALGMTMYEAGTIVCAADLRDVGNPTRRKLLELVPDGQ